VDFRRGLEL
jgi:hypothetical protein